MDGRPTTDRLTRRGFVTRLAALATVAGLAPLLEACAPSAPAPAAKPTEPAAKAPEPTKPAAAAPAAPQAAPAAPAAPAAASPAPAAPAAAGQGTPGGTLRTTLTAEPGTIDPHRPITTYDFSIRGALFNGLVEETPSLEVKPALAESWEAPDARTFTFKLRRGLKFHDGSEVNAAAVEGSFKRAADPAVSPAAAIKGIADRVATITAPDPYTIRFELKAPNGVFLPDLSELMIVPPNFDPARPVGTGPFQFVEWVRNQRLRVKKSPDYVKPGLPYLDEVVYQTTPDEDQRLSLLRTGQIDFVDVLALARVKDLEKEGKFQIVMVEPGQRTSSYIMRINCSKAPLDNPKVRQAINYAIDRDALLDVNFGYGAVRSNFVPSKHWAFNPNARSYDKRDVARARQLLAEAGQSNLTIELTHHTVSEVYKSTAQVIQANLADAGIKVNLAPLELGVWVDKVLQKRDFQLALSGNSVRSDPDTMFSDMYDQTRVNGGAIQWQHEEAQKLLVDGRALVNRDDRKKLYARFQEIVQEETPIVVLNEIPALHAGTPAVQGYQPDLRSLTYFETVWLKK